MCLLVLLESSASECGVVACTDLFCSPPRFQRKFLKEIGSLTGRLDFTFWFFVLGGNSFSFC